MGNESNQLHVFVQEMAILPRVGEFTTPSGYHSGNDSMIWRRGEERRGEEALKKGERRLLAGYECGLRGKKERNIFPLSPP